MNATPDIPVSLADLDVSGADVLAEVRAVLTRYVVFPSPEAADAVTLYAAATYAAREMHAAPRLIVKSPVKRCGKSRLIIDVLGSLVSNPLPAVSMSAAALVHSIDPEAPPTIILDETDTVFGKGSKSDEKVEMLRGVLNSGFNRGVPYVRYDAQARRVVNSETFAFAVLGGIDNGNMPDTIEDRAVTITLRRKTASEDAARFRGRRDKPKITAVAERLSAWVSAHADELGRAEPDLPEALNDRAQDVWEGLLAVADLAGEDWPARAKTAALALSGETEDASSEYGMRLLSDMRAVFEASGRDRLSTAVLIRSLGEIEEAPWGDWYGKPVPPRKLAELLSPYGVKPRKVAWDGEKDARGYHLADLADAWTRYLDPAQPGSDSAQWSSSGGTPSFAVPAVLEASFSRSQPGQIEESHPSRVRPEAASDRGSESGQDGQRAARGRGQDGKGTDSENAKKGHLTCEDKAQGTAGTARDGGAPKADHKAADGACPRHQRFGPRKGCVNCEQPPAELTEPPAEPAAAPGMWGGFPVGNGHAGRA